MLGNPYQNRYPMKKMITYAEKQMWNRTQHREAKRRRPIQKGQMVIEKKGELHHVRSYKEAARILGTSAINIYLKLRNAEYSECYFSNCKVQVG